MQRRLCDHAQLTHAETLPLLDVELPASSLPGKFHGHIMSLEGASFLRRTTRFALKSSI